MSVQTQQLLDLAIRIQQIPAPTFEETRRAEFVRDMFAVEGVQNVSVDDIGNVFACIPGHGQAKPLIVSAHLDTVFPASTNLEITREQDRIVGPGIGDNSLGVAALFSLLWNLRKRTIKLPGNLWLVANVCEEGLGNLRGMRAVVDRFGGDVEAYLVIEGLSLGYIQHRALSVRRYRISIHTSGGHSWSDYGQPSALHELSDLVTRLTAVALPMKPRTTMNVGRMCGGTSINSIASDAWLELDLRSENPQILEDLVENVMELVDMSNASNIQAEVELVGMRPAGELPVKHPLVKLARKCLQKQGIEPNLIIGSTDANIPLKHNIPALVLGVTNGGGAHTMGEYINTKPIGRGIEQLLDFVGKAWQ